MPGVTRLVTRKAGPLGLALTAYDLWRRLPEAQRRRLVAEARKHGPRIAAKAVEQSRRQLRKRSR